MLATECLAGGNFEQVGRRPLGRLLPAWTEGAGVKHLLIFVALGITLSLARADEVPFKFGKKRAILIPVKVGDSVDSEFRLDTGLGFDLISPQLAKKLGLEPTPNTKVHPVTGGEFELAQTRVPSLAVGSQKESDWEVLVGEPRAFVPKDGENKVDGILSLAFFRNHPFTLDYANQKLVLEDSESLARRKAAGKKVECRMSDENVVASVNLMLTERAPEPEKPGGLAGLLSTFSGGPPDPPKAWVQVDTGSEPLLLDSRLMFTLRVDATGANITETEPADQNGKSYRAWSGQMGKVELSDSPLAQTKLPVVFRKLLAEGVLGQEFLRQYIVTFDLPSNELIFAKP